MIKNKNKRIYLIERQDREARDARGLGRDGDDVQPRVRRFRWAWFERAHGGQTSRRAAPREQMREEVRHRGRGRQRGDPEKKEDAHAAFTHEVRPEPAPALPHRRAGLCSAAGQQRRRPAYHRPSGRGSLPTVWALRRRQKLFANVPARGKKWLALGTYKFLRS